MLTPPPGRGWKPGLLACTLLLTLPLAALAQPVTNPVGQSGDRIVTVAAPFLQIGPDARSAALGEASVAIIDNANALFYNPSALAFLDNRWGVMLNYTPWLRSIIPGINHYYVPGYYNLGERGGVISGALTYFSLGQIQFRSDQGIEEGVFQANELAVTVGYSRKLSEKFAVGASLKYINSNLAGARDLGGISIEPGQSVAGDIGIQYRTTWDGAIGGQRVPFELSLGAAISNIGAKMNYTGNDAERDFLPTNLKLGGALRAQLDEYNALLVTADINKLMVPTAAADRESESVISGMFSSFGDAPFNEELEEISISTGFEYWYNDLFAARTGFFYEAPSKGDRKYISLGVGFKYEAFTFDFSFLQPLEQQHPLQNTLRFSIGYAISDSQ